MKPHNVEAARELRQRMTPAETAAWRLLRDRRLGGVKFRRQHPVGAYVLDFCCPSLRLAIELDGSIHEHQAEADVYRQQELESRGYRVLRFSNDDVMHRPEWFIARVKAALTPGATLTPGPSPTPVGEGSGSPRLPRRERGLGGEGAPRATLTPGPSPIAMGEGSIPPRLPRRERGSGGEGKSESAFEGKHSPLLPRRERGRG